MVVHLVITHVRLGFSIINHPTIGVPPVMETPNVRNYEPQGKCELSCSPAGSVRRCLVPLMLLPEDDWNNSNNNKNKSKTSKKSNRTSKSKKGEGEEEEEELKKKENKEKDANNRRVPHSQPTQLPFRSGFLAVGFLIF